MYKVILFDDNSKIRTSLELMINGYDDFQLIQSFPDYSNIVQKIKEYEADLAIMDIEIPPKNGIEAVSIIRKELASIPILMFTVFEDDDKIFRSICAGAQGYLLKSASPEDIINALRELMQGGAPMTPSIARKILKKFSEEIKVTSRTKNEPYHLTRRELEILKLLKEGNSYRGITDALKISYDTVRTHISNIYTKLHVASKEEAIAKAIDENLLNK
jgi:DNA-binding NarL/FixJ family response regulator